MQVKRLAQVQLGTAATTVGSAATSKFTITALTFANTDAAVAYQVTVYLVPAAGTAGDTNMVRKSKSILPNESWVCSELLGHTLEVGDFVQALASTAAKITATISGVNS